MHGHPYQGYMIEPSREEIAHALDVPLEKVQNCMNRAYSTEIKECDDSMQVATSHVTPRPL